MSGFYADNSRIRVLETVGGTDETVFDTDENMPHIVGTAEVSSIAVDFSNLTQTTSYSFTDYCSSNSCIGYEWNFVTNYTPSNWFYDSRYVFGTWNYERTYSYFGGGWTYQRVSTPGFTEYFRVYEAGFYTYDREFVTVFDACCVSDVYITNIDARESSNTQNLANLPVDEDGNAIPVDFIVVQATGSRTTAGKDPRFNQALPSTVPTKTFSFQGSVLLESSGKANGDSFMRRIMSVFVSGDKLKLKSQESVGALTRGANNATFPHAAESRSTYNFNFKVFFGRFKS
jgi:hypothetical protein